MSPSFLDALASGAPTLSFEFFPPRDDAGALALAKQVASLEALAPDFVSVTYGAGGGQHDHRQRSVETTLSLGQMTAAPRLAHIALAGHVRDELEALVDQFLQAKVAGLMALRGDPPGGPGQPWVAHGGGLTYACELVAIIRQRTDLPIGVAAFPYGHPTAPSLEFDTEVMRIKRAAGANFAITQVLFEAQAYGRMVERLAKAGVGMPVIPGIMPITPKSSVAKLELFSGARLPTKLRSGLEAAAGDLGATKQVGVEWSAHLVEDLLAAGAPGVHFYTLNSASITAPICHQAGLGPKRR
ncbi:MAG: methylenetetrahydrofolate reductase [Micrococcales bacterium]|nr:methylenetetrahydrofolate reductase [Micrococcales bacterium]